MKQNVIDLEEQKRKEKEMVNESGLKDKNYIQYNIINIVSKMQKQYIEDGSLEERIKSKGKRVNHSDDLKY